MNLFLKTFLLFYLCLINLILIHNSKNENQQYETKVVIQDASNRIIRDVLFINGFNNSFSHLYRYRVLHQIEQLKAGNLECFELYYQDLKVFFVLDFRIIIFYRCPWSERVNQAINLAKSLNKKVLFDIDDLVFDTYYTNILPYVKSLSNSQKLDYNKGVLLMRKTLNLCDGAITTTEALAKELKKYVQEVFVNHNVASEKMFQLSQNALETKNSNENKLKELVIGYFSGSITNQADIEIVIPAFIKILREFKNVKLYFLGEINIPDELKEFSSKIIKSEFVVWENLPGVIANFDINIAPIEENIFNSVKSENKWIEASLVKVPTVASNLGIFKEMINHGVTGLLCKTEEEWYKELKTLLLDENLRNTIGKNAFEVCKNEYNSVSNNNKFVNYINSFARKHIGFFLPSLDISGGTKVVLVHASFLQEKGYDIDLIIQESKMHTFEFQGHKFNVIGMKNSNINCQYDIIVATFFTTLSPILSYYKAKRKLYLVQSYETDFYAYGDKLRVKAEKTYNIPFGIEYITISKWCKTWLEKKYQKKVRFAPNGIFLSNFTEHKRNLNKEKIRILIEGDSNSLLKNIDESFKIVEKLDKNKYEIWYMSYNGGMKSWYRVDKFFIKVPYEKVNKIYENCDILIKSSWLESFSFPPLEMMATGGYCIVVPNSGNEEYLKDEENCLFYKQGDIDSAVQCIEKLISNEDLQQRLYKNGLTTAKERDWSKYKDRILSLYVKE